MVISKDDKVALLNALETEESRLRRAMNTSVNAQIKEILQVQIVALRDLAGRITNEVTK